ncbi:MAG TPA: rod shape-determining protein MreC [Vicinamibacteria bacterium]|nr:rod shape-determining protein MreC [Vicinamibacteria bacterium]
MRIRGLLLLTLVGVVCLGLLTLQSRGQVTGARDALAVVTTPLQLAFARTTGAARAVWATYVDWKNIRAENRRLREEIQRLRVDGLRVEEVSYENGRLRRLLALEQQLPLDTLAGEIIGREGGGWVRSLTINRGRGAGLSRLTPVIAPEGLVGRVVDIRPGSSVVQLLSDPASAIGAHVLRTRTSGVVEGQARGTLRLKYLARDGAALQVGDVVVTSGVSGLLPRGIPIGRIRALDDRGSALFHYAAITPAVDVARAWEVLLLVGSGSHDVTAYFPSDG